MSCEGSHAKEPSGAHRKTFLHDVAPKKKFQLRKIAQLSYSPLRSALHRLSKNIMLHFHFRRRSSGSAFVTHSSMRDEPKERMHKRHLQIPLRYKILMYKISLFKAQISPEIKKSSLFYFKPEFPVSQRQVMTY